MAVGSVVADAVVLAWLAPRLALRVGRALEQTPITCHRHQPRQDVIDAVINYDKTSSTPSSTTTRRYRRRHQPRRDVIDAVINHDKTSWTPSSTMTRRYRRHHQRRQDVIEAVINHDVIDTINHDKTSSTPSSTTTRRHRRRHQPGQDVMDAVINHVKTLSTPSSLRSWALSCIIIS